MSQEKFTCFWNGPFSQWCDAEFEVDGIKYNCAEQYMMAEKARLFEDQDTLEKIMASKFPREQKKLGRAVKNFDEDKWNNVAKDVVYKGSYAKFTQNKRLMDRLIETKGTTLVEASPYDRIWGIGLGEFDPNAYDRSKWQGKNWLGEVLTKLREDLLKDAELPLEA